MQVVEVKGYWIPPHFVLVRVRTDTGVDGWGETGIHSWPSAVLGAVSDIAEHVIGADPREVQRLQARASKGRFYRGGAIAAGAAAAVRDRAMGRGSEELGGADI